MEILAKEKGIWKSKDAKKCAQRRKDVRYALRNAVKNWMSYLAG